MSEGGENDLFAKPLYGLTPVSRVRIPSSPPASLTCREFPSLFSWKAAKYGHFSQFRLDKSDCGERTVLAADDVDQAVFSGAEMSSPTCNRLRSEQLAITNRRLCERDLTFLLESSRACYIRDESAFMPEGEESLNSVLPTGTYIICISTARAGWFADECSV